MVSEAPVPHSTAWRDAATTLLGAIDQETFNQLAKYRDLILSENRRINLTALRQREEVDYRLILESLRLWQVIRQRVGTVDSAWSLIDIGAGAGIPGVPLSIMMPQWPVIMVEATGKKSRFIQDVCDTLRLSNAHVEHARAEDLGRLPGFRESGDVVVARAVGPLSTLLELSMPLLRLGGRAFYPKGQMSEMELQEGAAAARELGACIAERVALPDIEGCPVTQVVIADKLAPIPERYPRRAGIPAKEPLGG